MANDYVEYVKEAYRVAGSRVSLDSVVYAFLRGESPDGIAESYPALSLEQVHGAEQARRDHPSLYAKVEAARGGAVTPRG